MVAVRRIDLIDAPPPRICHTLHLPVGDVITYTNKAPYKQDEPNEDCLAVIEIDEENFLLVVADGVGGSPAGAYASGMVVDALVSGFTQETSPAAVPSMVIAAIEKADLDIKAKGMGSASTVAIAHVSAQAFRAIHVGDSVAMVCGGRGKLKFETISHSPVGYGVEAGLLSADEAFSHADRHLVSNILGGQAMHITLGVSVPLRSRDTLLLATDGLTDNLRQEEIIDCIRKGNLAACGEQLAAMARLKMASGKPDDMSFILFRRGAAR